MMEQKYYSHWDERAKLLDSYNNRGFRCKHDDYTDKDGSPTDGKSGRLTFSNDIEESQPIIKSDVDILREKCNELVNAVKKLDPASELELI